MNTLSKDVALNEFEKWYEYKKLPEYLREDKRDDENQIISAFMDGRLVMNEDFELKFNSEHEIYCFISLFNNLPHEKKVLMEKKLTDAVQSLVCTDPEKWKFYVPQPVHFVSNPEVPTFGMRKRDIDKNLAYLVSMVNENGVIYPNWKWGQHETFWKRAKVHWTGILTVKTLKVLSKFDRIDW